MIFKLAKPITTLILKVDTDKKPIKLKIDMSYSQSFYQHYKDKYTIYPKYIEQVLDTKDKVMDDDMTFKEITIHKTTNKSGGYTVNIGEGDVNG